MGQKILEKTATGADRVVLNSVPNTTFQAHGATATNKGEDRLGGTCLAFSQASSLWIVYTPIYKSATTFEIAAGSAHLQGNTLASGSSVKCDVRIPIVGWY